MKTNLSWLRRKLLPAAVVFLCSALSATADDNLLKNGNFEKRRGASPQQWDIYSDQQNQWFGKMVKDDASKGSSSVRFSCHRSSQNYQCIAQPVRVKPGERYLFSVQAANDPLDPLRGKAHGQLSMEWRDSQGKELGRVYSQAWDAATPSNQWVQFTLDGVAPEKAALAQFVITLFSEGESAGSFLVDDAKLVRVK